MAHQLLLRAHSKDIQWLTAMRFLRWRLLSFMVFCLIAGAIGGLLIRAHYASRFDTLHGMALYGNRTEEFPYAFGYMPKASAPTANARSMGVAWLDCCAESSNFNPPSWIEAYDEGFRSGRKPSGNVLEVFGSRVRVPKIGANVYVLDSEGSFGTVHFSQEELEKFVDGNGDFRSHHQFVDEVLRRFNQEVGNRKSVSMCSGSM